MMARAMHNPEFDWDFKTTPQRYVKNREVAQSRGKGLGGSSLVGFFDLLVNPVLTLLFQYAAESPRHGTAWKSRT